jgi:hypothetical protein
MPHITFTPLRGNRYRVNGTGKTKAPIVKKAQVGPTRRMYDNGNRKPPPKIKPVPVELQVVRSRYAEGICPNPSCRAYHYYGTFGRVACQTCSKPFKLEKIRGLG